MINTPLALPCGAIIKNRLCKAAMTERLCSRTGIPNHKLTHLYKRWAETGTGLQITGNVMIDRNHLESAGNIIIDSDVIHPEFKALAEAGKIQGNHIWVQISHSGRQTSRFVNLKPKSASEVQLKKMGLFGKPRSMTESDIKDVIVGFARAARVCKGAGFTGVQIHAAHGYLLSQFLSPITNHRKDQWGGSLDNRSRLLLSIIDEVRKEVGPDFPISVKLNSADFQRGGFSEEESIEVIKMLEESGIDLLEISGGTYEKVVFFLMNGENTRESTRRREAYFLDFAEKVREITSLPLMVTGGFRTHSFSSKAIEDGAIDMVGMARPFITNLDEIKGFISGDTENLLDLVIRTGVADLEETAEAGFYARNILRIAQGKEVKFKFSSVGNATFFVKHEFVKGMARRIFGSK
ncbi:MAG: NADH:flavin oxidoreductase/NADH oxidase family protein [Saprospiraceae bacterium]|nr:NADH:flavin oxidoreductase/NADH oxidase family protein [Saprospiraceae bacterium]